MTSLEGSPASGIDQPPVDEGDGTVPPSEGDGSGNTDEGEGSTDVDVDTSSDATESDDEGSPPPDETGDVDAETIPAPALRNAPASIQSIEEVNTGTVVITISSADESIANTLPATASWTVSQDNVVLDSDIFADGDLALPAAINVNNPVPYGHYTVTVDAGPTFQPYSDSLRVDEAEESFNINLVPVKTSSVTVNVESSNTDIASTLPATASWTVSQDNVVLDSDTFADGNLALPTSIPVNSKLPYGTYDVVVDAGPTFAPYSHSFEVNQSAHTFTIELVALATQSSVTINLSSADAGVATRMPAGSSWSVSNGTLTLNGDFNPEHLKLPVSIPVESPLPVGDYTITINAGPTFASYSQTVTLNQVTQAVDIALVPAAHANVTIALSSADVDVDQLPETATWTVTNVDNPDFTFTDTFAPSDLMLPRQITVNNPVPYGTYTVTVDAGLVFKTYTATVVIDQVDQVVPIELMSTSLVDQIVQILIQILTDILNETPAE